MGLVKPSVCWPGQRPPRQTRKYVFKRVTLAPKFRKVHDELRVRGVVAASGQHAVRSFGGVRLALGPHREAWAPAPGRVNQGPAFRPQTRG